MQKVKLQILGLSYSQTQDNAYVLILVEDKGDKRMPIIIGSAEAQAIAIELEKMKAPRPLTHDLFKSVAVSFDIDIDQVIIYKLEEGIFYARIIFVQNDKIVEIDSRTSDAVALAVRFNCPIYTTADVLHKAGIVLDLHQDKDSAPVEDFVEEKDDEFTFVNDSELEAMLTEAITKEDYERASQIRDEIQRRKSE